MGWLNKLIWRGGDVLRASRVAYQMGSDAAVAVRPLTQMAERGDSEAQFSLALTYGDGSGVPQDLRKSAKWMRRAAVQGHAQAQFGLGLMLAEGKGIPKNYGESAIWLRRAAEQGIEQAAFELSSIYATAHLVAVMDTSAKDIGDMAASARKMRDDLARNMTPEQIAAAERLADHMRE